MCQLPFPFPSFSFPLPSSANSPVLSLPFAHFSCLPRFPPYNLGQECFNFRDRFCLSSEAGWPVVQTMRCDGCKTIKKKERVGDVREQRGKELTLLDRFNYTE